LLAKLIKTEKDVLRYSSNTSGVYQVDMGISTLRKSGRQHGGLLTTIFAFAHDHHLGSSQMPVKALATLCSAGLMHPESSRSNCAFMILEHILTR